MAAALPFGSTPASDKDAPQTIQIAAGDGLLDIVKGFVESGVSVNAADEHGYTALYVRRCSRCTDTNTTDMYLQTCSCKLRRG